MAFTSVTIEGGLLSPDLLEEIMAGEGRGQKAADFGVSGSLTDEIQSAFSSIGKYWGAFQERLARSKESPTTLTREQWVFPFFEVLGMERLVYQQAAVQAGGGRFPISHRMGEPADAPPVHIVAFDHKDLGKRNGQGPRSPHALVQQYLNNADPLWGVVTNGARLRLLRDSERLAKPTFLEFDLQGMVEGNQYSEFALLYRLLHATRFPKDGADAHACLLERYYQDGIERGGSVRGGLRDGVKGALETLGTALLEHEDSDALRERIANVTLTAENYYRQLLRLVYRLLFLMVAEERRLLFPTDAADGAARVYANYYSVSSLRDRADRALAADPHDDLWVGLRRTFDLFREDELAQQLGLHALDGELFGPFACVDLENASCANGALLQAVRDLSLFREKDTLRRVNYAALDVEEFGSVYESLLDFHPKVSPDPPRFELESGSERKQTGSYYTPPELVRELVESALVPVVEERLAKAKGAAAQEQALLGLRVLDPACGSGHFLLAAARRIARELARVRSGEEEPSPDDYRHALRDVIRECIYAVDKNALAVDLCKVALWIEGHEAGLPLSFLDHHVRQGDSLVGVSDLSVLQESIPDGAYQPIAGDDKAVAKAVRNRNRSERAGQLPLGLDAPEEGEDFARAFAALAGLEELTPEDVHAKQSLYDQLREQGTPWWNLKLACDLWTYAFFAPLQPEGSVPTTADERMAASQPDAVHGLVAGAAQGFAQRHPFFHWPLEFPEVLGPGGFDLVLGNPPWDTLSPDRKEFFAHFDPTVRFLDKKGQDTLIESLLSDPQVASRWGTYERDLYATVRFLKNSGRYRLFARGNLGKGDFNVYRMFVETAMALTRDGGSAAQIVPSGFYSGANAAAIRSELFENWNVARLIGFINKRQRWFPAIHPETRFALYVAHNPGETSSIPCAFDVGSPEDLIMLAQRGVVEVPMSVIKLQSPLALSVPETLTKADLSLVERMQSRWPSFGDEAAGEPFRQYMREVDMGNDRNLFNEAPPGLPVYEGRMVDQFDHRAKGYESGRGRAAVWPPLEFGDPAKAIVPQWYISSGRIPSKVRDRVNSYRVGFCDVTSPNTDRSLVAALIPPGVVCGHKVPTLTYSTGYEWAYMLWLGVANSFVADYLVRMRIALSMSLTVMDTLPIPRVASDSALARMVVPRALRLTCVSPEMTAFWNQLAASGWCEAVPPNDPPPGYLPEEMRCFARAEIDAAVALRGFGLDRDDLSWILDTFSLLRRREQDVHGEYRTKRLTLEVYDAMQHAIESEQPYETLLDPPPSDPRVAHSTEQPGSQDA